MSDDRVISTRVSIVDFEHVNAGWEESSLRYSTYFGQFREITLHTKKAWNTKAVIYTNFSETKQGLFRF